MEPSTSQSKRGRPIKTKHAGGRPKKEGGPVSDIERNRKSRENMSDERYYERLREMQHYSAKKREKMTDEEYEEEKEKKRRGMADFREREKRGEVPEDSYRSRSGVPKTGERDQFTDPETNEKYTMKFNGRLWEREETADFAKKPLPEYPEILRHSYVGQSSWYFNDIWYSKMGILAWKKDLTEDEKEEVEKRTKEFRTETEEFLRETWCESIEQQCHEENCFYRYGHGTFIFDSYQQGDSRPIYEPIKEFKLGPTPKPFKDGGARTVVVQSYRPPKKSIPNLAEDEILDQSRIPMPLYYSRN